MTPAERKKYLRKLYYEKHKQRCYELNKKWIEENRDKVRANSQKYFSTQKGKNLKKKINKERRDRIIKGSLWGKKEVLTIYNTCKLLNMFRYTKLSVDHIIPVKGKDICGLHVPENLRIILSVQNDQKGINWAP